MKLHKGYIKAINAWLRANHFDTKVFSGDDFYYQNEQENISIPSEYSEPDLDTNFMICLRDLGLKYDFDALTLSVLHELGHFCTMEDVTEDDLDSQSCNIVTIQLMEISDNAKDFAYWLTPIERAANKWAVKYVNRHKAAVEKLENIIASYLW